MAYANSSVPVSSSDKDWYHGQLSKVEAEQALRTSRSGCDSFLIRESEGALVLSLIHRGKVHHVNIKHGGGRYELETGSKYKFSKLEQLVYHYSSERISSKLKATLGVACEKTQALPDHQHSTEDPSDERTGSTELSMEGVSNVGSELKRVHITEKNKAMAAKLKALMADLASCRDDSKQTRMDKLHAENMEQGRNKYRTLRQIRQGNTRNRVEKFETM